MATRTCEWCKTTAEDYAVYLDWSIPPTGWYVIVEPEYDGFLEGYACSPSCIDSVIRADRLNIEWRMVYYDAYGASIGNDNDRIQAAKLTADRVMAEEHGKDWRKLLQHHPESTDSEAPM